MAKHWHVMSGMAGYLPNQSDYYETRRDAEEGMRFWRDAISEGGEFDKSDNPDATKHGSVRRHCIVFNAGGRYSLDYVLKCYPCQDDCDPEQEY